MHRDSNSIRLPQGLPEPVAFPEPQSAAAILPAAQSEESPAGKMPAAPWEPAFFRVLSVPLSGGVRGGFTLPMHGIKVVKAFPEPKSVGGILPAENATLPARRRQHVRSGAGAAWCLANSMRMTFCWFVLATLCPAFAQEPRFVNAKIQTRAVAASLQKEFQSLVKDQAEPAWIGYSVPVGWANRTIRARWRLLRKC